MKLSLTFVANSDDGSFNSYCSEMDLKRFIDDFSIKYETVNEMGILYKNFFIINPEVTPPKIYLETDLDAYDPSFQNPARLNDHKNLVKIVAMMMMMNVLVIATYLTTLTDSLLIHCIINN